MSGSVTLRLAQRSDISDLAHNANLGNAQSALHSRMAPHRDQYPRDYYRWRLNIIRQRFATPNLRNVVAVDSSSGKILGQASWAVEGSETTLYKQWLAESSWMNWLEGKLIWAEKTWSRYLADRCTDYRFLDVFKDAFLGTGAPARPDCLHLHMIVVDPSTQSRGVGRLLVDWGKALALKEDLPIYLEATLEATGFYEKGGFVRISNDLAVNPDGQEKFQIPVFVWEGGHRQGRWLERDLAVDSLGERWKWREDALIR